MFGARGETIRAVANGQAALVRLATPAEALAAPALAALDRPALVIRGEAEAYLPLEQAEFQRRAFPSARVVTLPGTGHWAMHERSGDLRDIAPLPARADRQVILRGGTRRDQKDGKGGVTPTETCVVRVVDDCGLPFGKLYRLGQETLGGGSTGGGKSRA